MTNKTRSEASNEKRRKSLEGQRPNKWNDSYIIKAYELSASGLNNPQLAKALGISMPTFKVWLKEKPAFRDAVTKAREPRQNLDNMMGFLRSRMSKKVLKLWDQLIAWQTEPNAVRKIEALLKDKGAKSRQHLFVNALYAFNFNIGEACRFVNIRRSTFNKWVLAEPGFAELIDEVRQNLSDVFVSNLVKASNEGDVSATIFACKTLAKDRGFSEKIEVEHTHKGTLAIEDMNLDPKTLRAIRNALRDQRNTAFSPNKAQKRIAQVVEDDDDDVIDAEFEKKGDEEE